MLISSLGALVSGVLGLVADRPRSMAGAVVFGSLLLILLYTKISC